MTRATPTGRWASPLRYPGGKVRMTGWLVETLNSLEGSLDRELWIEPFGGGAGAALMALTTDAVQEAWIVESNPALAAFWTTIMADDGQLAARVETTSPTLADFMAATETVAAVMTGESVPAHEAGLAAFLVNRCSRSGIVAPNVGPIGGKAQSGRYTICARFNGPALANRIRAVSALGQRFRPHHGDGITWIEQLSGSGVEHEAFLFVDPPYIGPGNRLYAEGMDAAGHDRLAVALTGCSAPWVLTYDAHPRVLELYERHRVREFEISYTAAGSRIATEYVVLADGLTAPMGNPLGRGSYRAVA